MLFHNCPWDTSRKVNAILRLEFELAYPDIAVQRVNYYTKRTTPYPSSYNLNITTTVNLKNMDLVLKKTCEVFN